MQTKESVSIIGFIIILLIAGILVIKQRISHNPQDTQPSQEQPQEKSTPQDTAENSTAESTPDIYKPLIVLTSQETQEKSNSATKDIKTQQLPLYTWDILEEQEPQKIVTFEGEILQINLDESMIVRIDTANGVKPNTHTYFTINGDRFNNQLYPTEGNILYFQAAKNGSATATTSILPITESTITVRTDTTTFDIALADLPKTTASWNTMTPLGFTNDGEELFILAENKKQNTVTANALYQYNIATKKVKELFAQPKIQEQRTTTIVKLNTTNNTLILERYKNNQASLQSYNPNTEEYTLLIPAEEYQGLSIEHPNLISPTNEHVILYDNENKEYILYNTSTQQQTAFAENRQPIGWLDAKTILTLNDNQYFILDIDQNDIVERTIPQQLKNILGIINPTS